MTSDLWAGLDDEGRAFLSETLGELGELRESGEPSATGPPVPATQPIGALLGTAARSGASDVHLARNMAPHVRIGGQLRPLADTDPLDQASLDRMLLDLLDSEQQHQLRSTGDLDVGFELSIEGTGVQRFRASLFRQSGGLAAAFRLIPDRIPDLATLGLPAVVGSFAEINSGLVLVTGQTGSGKSTTLASMISAINGQRTAHIVTIEDPIEYRHPVGRCVIQQREVGPDTQSFATALRHALRQDPDVLLIGELRDLETIRTALTAAETGHLVLATLHSSNVTSAVNRLIDVFPEGQQAQIRSQLALSLAGILSQQLVLGRERALEPATEVMVATMAVRNIIREDKIHQLGSTLETSGADGMHTFDQSLAALVRAHRIDRATAMAASHNAASLQEHLG